VFRIAGLAFDQRREIGWRGLLARAVRRRPTPSPASDPMPPPGVHFDVIYAIGYWPG
jgi:hypothetical protein